ncbi:WD40-repeat-containing domain protein [Halteromyces radiatus]|uniref:WD40-repeat-containing domain protein n=1 Tax=Halteromyces radiatus TaxID=101107 RepID=UPI00221FFD15|nr:WD40-repeat-containing domain protein [Halteromyces radiatus]KAI8081728.1 WD40-repeat-containing domain protein [Halteromyces radiatus]
MNKENQNVIIIISDDESDDIPTSNERNKKKQGKNNGSLSTYGLIQSQPILLDDDEPDTKLTRTIPSGSQKLATKQPIKNRQSLPSDSLSPTQPIQLKSPQPSIPMTLSTSISDLPPVFAPTSTSTDSSPSVLTEIKLPTLSLPSLESTTNITTTTTTMANDAFYFSAQNLFGLTQELIDQVLTSESVSELKHTVPEPDWTSVINMNDKTRSKTWQSPSNTSSAATTLITPLQDMELIELFTRLDHYQDSVNHHLEGLSPRNEMSDILSTSSSQRTRLSASSRRSLKRKATTTRATIVQSTSTLGNANNKDELRQALIQRLETPYLAGGMARPYIPAPVWQDSNWEDWAQFQPGDLMHVPFTEVEDSFICSRVQKLERKKRGLTAIFNDEDLWHQIASFLPGRDKQDCRFRYYDIINSKHLHLFKKPLLVAREKKRPPRTVNNYHDLISSRMMNQKVSQSTCEMAIWSNLHNRITVGEGSGDCLCLLLEAEPKSRSGIQIVAGSLCDDHLAYNIEGNLRTWQTSKNQVTQLRGHSTEIQSANGESNQKLWRTVHDLKMSNCKELIFSAGRDGNTKVWNAVSKKLLSTLSFHNGSVYQISVKPEEEHVIATSSSDGLGVIWKINKKGRDGQGAICETTAISDVEHCSAECVEFGNGPSSQMLFFGYKSELHQQPGWITAFDCTKATPIWDAQDIRGSVGCLAVSHIGNSIVSANYGATSGDQLMHLHDAKTGKSILKAFTGHLDVNSVCFSQCDNYIVSGSVANEVAIVDIRKPSRPVYTFTHSDTDDRERYIAPDSNIGIGGMHWMKNNQILITGGGDCRVKFWDVKGENGLIRSYETSNPVNCLSVNEDLQVLAAGVSGSQGVVHIWQP